MPPRLLVAPAGAGKTAYLIHHARQRAHDLSSSPRVIVPSRLQVQAWRRRLAEAGGALGVQVGTFDDLYRAVLYRSDIVVTRLTDPVQFRLLRRLLDEAPLTHYASLRTAPGFVQVLRDLIRELKAGGVFPEQFTEALEAMGGEPRLTELAQLYAAYQERLQQEGWADYAGIGWLAAEALQRQPRIGTQWSTVMVDGFDDLTTVQIQALRHLSDRVGDLVITLTGTVDGSARELVHKRFNRTRQRLEEELDVKAEPLPRRTTPASEADLRPHASEATASALTHLERTLFSSEDDQRPAERAVTLIATPDREAEVRTALRWLKACIVRDGMGPGQVAVLYRSGEPYRPFLGQTAQEFGLPLRIVDGLPLQRNPAVAALLSLLRLALPAGDYLAWRETVGAWRSPYFDWEGTSLSITSHDAEMLDMVARWGSVIGGMEHWRETFDLLRATAEEPQALDEEGPPVPDLLPTGDDAERLWELFRGFVERITPPRGHHSCRDFVAWLEDLIGDVEPDQDAAPAPAGRSLGLARQALDGPSDLAERDLAALEALKDILRGLVWAEEAVGCAAQSFATFFADLEGAVDAATYRIPLPPDEETILAADVAQARGLPFRAVAVLGLAEGEFPQTLQEDPFLRDADRCRLRRDFDLQIDLSTEGAETEYFYEAITRPREALLLTRPRIADNGAPWQASPYWEEVRRRLEVTPQRLTTQHRPTPDKAASWPEVLQTLSTHVHDDVAWAWAADHRPAACDTIERAVTILAQRTRQQGDEAATPARGAYDGDLTRWGETFRRVFGPGHTWSASRLEAYHTCPFFFFVGSVLDLEPRARPIEGLDARQLGNIYHHVFEQLYRAVGHGANLEGLLEALPDVAREVLDAAPHREQFRATAWWEQTRQEIEANVVRSLEALESRSDDFTFYRAEQTFGIPDRPGPPLVVHDGADALSLRGYIDRVDRSRDGPVRIIDYKTAGPYSYTDQALREGKKLQLALYALAAEQALRLGAVAEGFYWHVRHAEPSKLTLSEFGPAEAMETAVAHAWEAVRGARGGCFVPQVPDDGCPSYCPAAAFCWHFAPRRW